MFRLVSTRSILAATLAASLSACVPDATPGPAEVPADPTSAPSGGGFETPAMHAGADDPHEGGRQAYRAVRPVAPDERARVPLGPPPAAAGGPGAPSHTVRVETVHGPAVFEAVEVDGLLIAEGDVVLGAAADLLGSSGIPGTLELGVSTTLGHRWPDGIMPYTLDTDSLGKTDTATVQLALQRIAERSPVRFVVRTNQPDFASFTRSSDPAVSSSSVGRQGGAQTIAISQGAGVDLVEHEIFHALGYFHEQSRPDRDGFVQVDSVCIQPAQIPQFAYQSTEGLGSYDLSSVMQYGSNFFCIARDTQDVDGDGDVRECVKTIGGVTQPCLSVRHIGRSMTSDLQRGPASELPPSSSGSAPARQSDDLPTPDSPVTSTKGSVRKRSTTARTSGPRPKNSARCAASNGRRPRYGLPAGGSGPRRSPPSASSASQSSCPEAYRWRGASARQRSITAPRSGARSDDMSAIAGACWWAASLTGNPRLGGAPLARSKSSAPSENTSERALAGSPHATSGAM